MIDAPDPADVAFLEDRLLEFNTEATGIRDARLLAILVRDDAGGTIAGLYGWTWDGCCEVNKLWIDAPRRHRGLGTRLMAAAEAEARRRGAAQMVVDDYPRGHRKFVLRKALAAHERGSEA